MKLLLMIASSLGALSVMLGAFGAHVLKNNFSEYAMMVFEKGVRYQIIHALAIFASALAGKIFPQQVKIFLTAGWFFTFAIVLFSGSLYIIAFSGIKQLGAITPLGGFAFIAGWILLAIASYRVM